MNVLLLNGSPHKKGCTFTALSEISTTLKAYGIDSTMVQLGTQPVPGCIACQKCRTGLSRCIFNDEPYQQCVELLDDIDGIVIGSPVYYAGPNGSLCALLDRLFYSSSAKLAGKPAAAIVSCRRGGASASFDRLNKYFTINSMPVVASQYWNSVHGNTPEEVRQDLEGLQTMRTLAANMAWMLKSIKTNPDPRPQQEPLTLTNFIR